jgi:hypothetical protein
MTAGAGGTWRRMAAVLVLIGAVLTALYGVRVWRQWAFDARVLRGEVQVEALRGWMTLPYIERRFGVPEAELRRTLGAPAAGDAQRSLHDWIGASGRDPEAVRHDIEALILAYRTTTAAPAATTATTASAASAP